MNPARTPPRRTGLLLLGLLLPICVFAQEPPDTENVDPWVGRSRDEVVRLFGEPDRVRRDAAGAETLTYKVIRLGEATDPGPEVIVVSLPGVGRIGRRFLDVPSAVPGYSYEPETYDETGRPTGGGLTQTQRYEKSIATGRKSHSASAESQGEPSSEDKAHAEHARRLSGQRLKLILHLDAAGRVSRWEVS